MDTANVCDPAATTPAPWPLPNRVGFRFAFAFLVLYLLPFPFDMLPDPNPLGEAWSKLWAAPIAAVGKFFGMNAIDHPTGSGDTAYNYCRVLLLLVLAVVVTVAWSVLDRKRANYTRLYDYLRVYVRYNLAVAMLGYGLAKLIPPLQFPAPTLGRLTETYGDSSPMALLWTFMGYSVPYTMFAGAGEATAGLLMLFRRTTTVGSLLAVFVMANVVMLNLCYDVPVKLYSASLLLMAVFLLLPDLKRLWYVLVLNRPVETRDLGRLCERRGLHISSQVCKAVFVSAIFVLFLVDRASILGLMGGEPLAKLEGRYVVRAFTESGVGRDPWIRVTILRRGGLVVETEGGTRSSYMAVPEKSGPDLRLSGLPGEEAHGRLSYKPLPDGGLDLEGEIGEATVKASLERLPAKKSKLTGRPFHWVQEYPYNR